MFIKYNAVLRGKGNANANAFLRSQFELVCKGNSYATTLHVIDVSISKVSGTPNKVTADDDGRRLTSKDISNPRGCSEMHGR